MRAHPGRHPSPGSHSHSVRDRPTPVHLHFKLLGFRLYYFITAARALLTFNLRGAIAALLPLSFIYPWQKSFAPLICYGAFFTLGTENAFFTLGAGPSRTLHLHVRPGGGPRGWVRHPLACVIRCTSECFDAWGGKCIFCAWGGS